MKWQWLGLAGLGVCASFTMGLRAQQPVAIPAPSAVPLSRMPYSPSLDLASMDQTAKPCENFYQYVCGGWVTHNPIPADQAGWSVYAKLENDNQQFLWGILDADAKATPRTPVQQKVGDYFESCMNTSAIDSRGVSPISAAMSRMEGETDRRALLSDLMGLSHDYPVNAFFRAGTDQDASDSSSIIVVVAAGGLGLPDRDYYTKDDAHSAQIREQYSAYVLETFVLSGETPAQASSDAAAVLRIETALARTQLTRVERRDPHKLYHRMTLAALQQLTPAVPWPVFFQMQMLSLPQASASPGPIALTKITGDQLPFREVNVEQPEFMKVVQKELTTEPVDALKAYLRFHLASAAAPYLAKPFADANFNFYSHTLRGVAEQPPRWKTCVRAVDRNLGEALGQEFVARTFSADMKSKTELMTGEIETEMAQEIQALDWMSSATKAEALRKLHAIRNKIGYPAQWRDYALLDVKRDDYFGDAMKAYAFEEQRQWHKLGKPVDLNEWGMTPPTVNAYFNPQMNDINFPAGVLQPPLYDPSIDDAPNYGNTGATIGHELTHAFDDEGRQFDSKGNLRDWWTPADAKGFEDRINCVRDQYARYTVIDGIHINSRLTSGEDVADLGGTLLAYLAWQMHEQGKPLQNAEGFTPDQRFFIGMGQWACESIRPEALRVQAITDPHSPGFARINGVVSNLPQFQKAFSCKAGEPMVHTPTCKVW